MIEAPDTTFPREGQCYQVDGDDRIWMYVRTETRPGMKHPEHLYITTGDRMVYSSWRSEPMPKANLVIDTQGRQQAAQQAADTFFARLEVALLVGLLKQACEWLPRQRAQELRQAYSNQRAEWIDG